MGNKLLVTPAPFQAKAFSTNAIMYAIMVALLPSAISGVVVFGIKALYLILISVATGYVFDLIYNLCFFC